MAAYLLIMAIAALVLVAVWQWDERARRAELRRRRHIRLMGTSHLRDSATSSPS
jgi:hypothetical protein